MSKRKTSIKWFTDKSRKHLSADAKEYLRQKKHKPKIHKPVEYKNTKYRIHFKAKYDSPRGTSHDFFVEGTLTKITSRTLSQTEMQNLILEHLQSGTFEDDTGFSEFYDTMHYTSIEIGIERNETDADEKESMEVDKIGYRIET